MAVKTPEARIEPSVICLKGLIGGDFTTRTVSGSPEDPDEGGDGEGAFFGLGSDPINRLGFLTRMNPADFGILIRSLRPEDVRRDDNAANQRSREASKRHQKII